MQGDGKFSMCLIAIVLKLSLLFSPLLTLSNNEAMCMIVCFWQMMRNQSHGHTGSTPIQI